MVLIINKKKRIFQEKDERINEVIQMIKNYGWKYIYDEAKNIIKVFKSDEPIETDGPINTDKKPSKKELNKKYRETHKDYFKKYNEENKQHIKDLMNEYYQNKKEELKIKSKLYRDIHKDELKEKRKEYKQRNKEKINTYQKQYYHRNKEEQKESNDIKLEKEEII